MNAEDWLAVALLLSVVCNVILAALLAHFVHEDCKVARIEIIPTKECK